MLTKVRVTQEQADVLHKVAKMVKDIPANKVISALEKGFEVGLEFGVGDWVVHTPTGSIEKVIKCNFGIIYTDERSHHEFNFRHATPEEIAKEKERRWWAKHDRDVWELRKGDALKADDGGYLVEVREVFDSYNVRLTGGVAHVKISDLKEGYRVICFAEDRKDA